MTNSADTSFQFIKDIDLYHSLQEKIEEAFQNAYDSSSSCLITAVAKSKFGNFKARLMISKYNNKIITKFIITNPGRASSKRIQKIKNTFKSFCSTITANIVVCEKTTMSMKNLLRNLELRMQGRYLNKLFYVQTSSNKLAEVITKKIHIEGKYKIALEINGTAISKNESDRIVKVISKSKEVINISKNGLITRLNINSIDDIPATLNTALPISSSAVNNTVEFILPGNKKITISRVNFSEQTNRLSIRVAPKGVLTPAQILKLQLIIEGYDPVPFSDSDVPMPYIITSMRNTSTELIKSCASNDKLADEFDKYFLTPPDRSPLIIRNQNFSEILLKSEIADNGTVLLNLSKKLNLYTISKIVNSINSKGKRINIKYILKARIEAWFNDEPSSPSPSFLT